MQKITLNCSEDFRRKIFNADWNVVSSEEEPDEAYNLFLGIFKDIYGSVFPFMEMKRPRKIRKPWVTPELLAKINMKCLLYKKKIVKPRNAETLSTFKSYRINLNKLLRNARSRYFSYDFSSSGGRYNLMWKKLNAVLKRENTSNPVMTLR